MKFSIDSLIPKIPILVGWIEPAVRGENLLKKKKQETKFSSNHIIFFFMVDSVVSYYLKTFFGVFLLGHYCDFLKLYSIYEFTSENWPKLLFLKIYVLFIKKTFFSGEVYLCTQIYMYSRCKCEKVTWFSLSLNGLDMKCFNLKTNM